MIYTAIVNHKDAPRDDIKCFSGENLFLRSVHEAKIYKVLSHKFTYNEFSVWVDGNIFLNRDEDCYIDLLGDADILVFKHPYRRNIFEEIDELKRIEKFRNDSWLMKKLYSQEEVYKDKNITGLYELNFIVRRNNQKVKRLNEIWWAEICTYGYRDQISFPLAVKESGVTVKTLTGNIRNHELFTYKEHLK